MKCFLFIVLSVAVGIGAWAQAPAKSRVGGTVTAVDPQSRHVIVKTDKGDAMTVVVGDHTFLLRLPPGENDVKKATKIGLPEIVADDKLLAIGVESADHKTLDATTVYILTKADVAQIHQKEEEDWQKRSTSGIVSAVDPAAQTLTLKVGSKQVVVQSSDKTTFRRYSPDSAKSADAKPSTFAEVKTGDQVRVLGNKDADGTKIEAEQVLAGAFRQIAATIESIDPQTHELKVKDLDTKKPLLIRIDADSQMNKLPPEVATMLARRFQGGRGQGRGGPGGYTPARQGGGEGRGAGRGGDVSQMLDHLPPMPVTDLKKGDAIMVLTTQGSDPTKVTAIRLLAGVEPLLTASPTATRDIMSGWNLGGGGGGEGN
jgi:transcription antitermination factor NusG